MRTPLDNAIADAEQALRDVCFATSEQVDAAEETLAPLHAQRRAVTDDAARAELAELRRKDRALHAEYQEARTRHQAATDAVDQARAELARHPSPNRYSYLPGTVDPRLELARLGALVREAEGRANAAASRKLRAGQQLLLVRRRRAQLLAQATDAAVPVGTGDRHA